MPELKVEATYVGQNLDRGLKGLQKELAQTADQAGRLGGSLGTSIPKGANAANTALNNLGKNAGQSIFNLTEKLKQLQSSVFTEKDTGKIAAYNKEIKATEKQIAILSSIGTSGLGTFGANATKAFSFLRVAAQVLPGIGIAGILAFAVEPIIEYASSLFGASEALKTTKKEAEDLKKATESIFSGAAKEAGDVVGLIAVLKSETETRERKLAALKELQKINPEIFNGLTLEKGAVEGLDAAYVNYIKSLKVVIAAKLKQKQIETEVEKLLKLQGAELTSLTKAGIKSGKEIAKMFQSGPSGISNVADILKEKDIRLAEARIADFSKQLTELSKGIDVKIPTEKKEGLKKDVTTISDILAELAKEIDFLNRKEPAFNTNETKAKLSAYFSTIDKLIKDFKPSKNLIDSLFADAGGIKIKNALATIRTEVERGVIAAPLEIPIDFAPKLLGESVFGTGEGGIFSVPPKDIQRIQDEAFLLGQGFSQAFVAGLGDAELKKTVDATLTNIADRMAVATELFASLGESLGKAFTSGGSFIGEALNSILNIVGDFLIKLGKAAIAQSALIKAIEAANPIAGLAAGIIAIAAGTILKTIKLPAFATGGASPGGSILVGERGPEIISPPRGSVITPNAQTNAILGGGGGVYIPAVTLRGQDLVIAFKRASDANGRNGQ